MELEGPYAQLMHGSAWAVQDGAWQFSFLRSRSATIAGGTAEIQLNIIGERVLGLPKAKDAFLLCAWRQGGLV